MALLTLVLAPDPALARRKSASVRLRQRVPVLSHYLARVEVAIP